MTEKQARILLKIGKYLVITILAIFFVVIIFQSIKISSLTNKQNKLQNEYNQKVDLNSDFNNQIDYIENNFDKFSEEELRKDDYKKDNETLVKGK